jgi:hypothetical protein
VGPPRRRDQLRHERRGMSGNFVHMGVQHPAHEAVVCRATARHTVARGRARALAAVHAPKRQRVLKKKKRTARPGSVPREYTGLRDSPPSGCGLKGGRLRRRTRLDFWQGGQNLIDDRPEQLGCGRLQVARQERERRYV